MTNRSPLKYRRFAEKMGGKALLPELPKGRRPLVETVIETFKRDCVLYSPSGLTANVLCMWLKDNKHPFNLRWSYPAQAFVVTSSDFVKEHFKPET